ncbi:MAG: hypothetical protein K8T20_16135 [Planctomycetes bacterium]|nr:hypothetical protein [Planctomycetota bacterium]
MNLPFARRAAVLLTLFALAGCGGDKSSPRKAALKEIGVSFSEYLNSYGCLPVPVGQTVESKVPSHLLNCPTCGKPWSYAKTTGAPTGPGAAEYDPVIVWCATCEADGNRRNALTYHGKVSAVPVTELRR